MVAQTHSMVFVTTESDAEALLLEANLIKQLKRLMMSPAHRASPIS